MTKEEIKGRFNNMSKYIDEVANDLQIALESLMEDIGVDDPAVEDKIRVRAGDRVIRNKGEGKDGFVVYERYIVVKSVNPVGNLYLVEDGTGNPWEFRSFETDKNGEVLLELLIGEGENIEGWHVSV